MAWQQRFGILLRSIYFALEAFGGFRGCGGGFASGPLVGDKAGWCVE